MDINSNTTNEKLDSIISAISIVNSALSLPIYIPSLQKECIFKQITTSQEKRLVKNLLAGDEKTFLQVILPVIKETCEDKSLDIEDLTLLDLYSIVIKLRIYSIGPDLTLRVSNKKAGSKSINVKVDLNKIYNQYIEKIKNNGDYSFTVEDLPYRIHGTLPKIKDLLDKMDTETFYDQIFDITVRMIDKIDLITNTGKETPIELSSLTLSEKMKVIENLPNATLTKVYEKSIENNKKIETLTLFDIENEGQKYKQTIDVLSVDFFTLF